MPNPWRISDPDKRAHFIWLLKLYALTNELGWPLAKTAEAVGIGRNTMPPLMTGWTWGLPETRVAVTWDVMLRLLASEKGQLHGLRYVLIAWEQGGRWAPGGLAGTDWHYEKGWARWRRH